MADLTALDPESDLTPEQLDGMDLWDRDVMLNERHRVVGAMLVMRAVREIRRHRAHLAADKERVRQVVRDVAYRTLDLGITSLDPDTARIADAIATRCADEICTHKETP